MLGKTEFRNGVPIKFGHRFFIQKINVISPHYFILLIIKSRTRINAMLIIKLLYYSIIALYPKSEWMSREK